MSKFGIGKSVRRIEDERFLKGQGKFVDDISLPGESFVFILRSTHPHAEILSMDVSKAIEAEGVLLVLTGEDVAADGLGGIPCTQLAGDGGWLKGHRTYQPLLVHKRVRHVGDRVAMVIAESKDQARNAAELINISYDPMPFVSHLERAGEAKAPLVWDDVVGNLCFEMNIGDGTAVASAMEKAHHIQKLTVRNNRVFASPAEPRSTIGAYNQGRYTLHTTCQKPHSVRQLLASAVFHEAEENFRVICPDVGGGFGLKGTMYPEDSLVLWAARKVGRPVKWTSELQEGLIGDTHGRDQLDVGELALDIEGNILALKVNLTVNLGAYLSISALVPTVRCVMNLSNVYAIPAMQVAAKSLFTHTTPMGPYRGAGMPEAVYLVERLLDAAARETGQDTVELRRRNLIKSSAMPYQTPLQYKYDSGDFESVLDKSLDQAGWYEFDSRREASKEQGKLRGIGMGFYVEAITPFSERMEIRVDAGGGVTVLAGTFSYGQGHATVYAQMVAQWLGVPPENVRLIQGDTDRVSIGRGSFGSRSITMGGSALKLAVEKIIEKGLLIAAHMLETTAGDLAFENGVFKVVGTDHFVGLKDVAGASFAPVGLPPGSGIGLEGTGYYDGPFNFPNGCHICEVEVDPATGQVEVKSYVAVDDLGVVINPLLAKGQLHGGIAQGLGQALCENINIDKETGQNLSGSLMDYALPRAADMPDFQAYFQETSTEVNPLGVKGAGENGCVPSPPAIINSILNALSPLGVTVLEMPATPERVWQAIKKAAN